MAIVGDHPSHGIRFVLTREDEANGRMRYTGDAFTPDARHALVMIVASDGAVEAESSGDAPPDLVEKARLLVRTAVRHARAEGVDPPRKIQRWRGEK